jgi:DNA polymerase-3 subunit gamma/tau
MVVAAGGGSGTLMFTAPTEADRIKQAAEQLGLATVLAAMQIVEQSLARMKQSTQGRILAELALVRICQLEELDELAELIGRINQPGATAAAPRAATPRPTPPTARSVGSPPGASSAPREKKSPEISGTATAGPSSDGPATAVAEPTTLTAENAESLWRAALGGLSTTTANHARQFDRVTVPAPGRLVVHFDAKHAFAKPICSHPSHIARFEQALAEVAGQTIRVEFQADEAPASTASERPADPRVSPQQRMMEITKHPLVRRANELFGAVPTRVVEE